jgi:hypothetical protein
MKRFIVFLNLLSILVLLASCDLFAPPDIGKPTSHAPKAPVVSGATPTNSATPTWTWTVTGEAVEVAYQLDSTSGAWISQAANATSYTPTVPLADGNHTLYVKSVNENGIWSQVSSHTIVVDTIPPSTPSVAVELALGDRRPQWTWSLPEGIMSQVSRFKYQLDGEDPAAWQEVGIEITAYRPESDLSLASHTLYVQAGDTAGNWSASGINTINLDSNAPVVVAATPTNDRTPTWTWTIAPGSEAAAVEYKLDEGGSWVSVAPTVISYTPVSDLPDGNHALYVRIRSSGGTYSAVSQCTVLVDTLPPLSPVVSGTASTTQRRPNWTWVLPGESQPDVILIKYRLDSGSPGVWTEAGPEVSMFQPTGDLEYGIHTFSVQAVDAAGNWSESGSFTTSVKPPTPVVNGLAVTNSATPTWTWSVSSDVLETSYLLDVVTGPWTTVSAAVTSFTPSEPLTVGTHTLFVRAGGAGFWSEAASFSTLIDTQAPSAPTVTGVSPTVEKRPTWNWNVPSDAGSGVSSFRYQLDGTGGSWTIVGASTTSYTLSFDLESSHSLNVQAGDLAGNWSATGSFTIEPIWQRETLDSRSSSVGYRVSMDLTASGNPAICYIDSASSSLLEAVWNGTSWQYATIDSGGAGNFVSMAIDQYGNRDVAYTDTTGKTLKVSFYDKYKALFKKISLEGTGASPLITDLYARVDNASRLYIGYTRQASVTKLMYFDGSYSTVPYDSWWSLVSFPGGGSGWAPSFARQTDGFFKVSWMKSAGVFMSFWKYETWQNGGIAVASPSLDASCKTATTRDAANMAGIAYCTPSEELWYAKEIGPTFDNQLVRAASSEPLGVFAIACDSYNNRPVLAYIEGSSLWCAVLTGSTWNRELVDTGVAEAASVCVDSNGRIMIAYYDGVNGYLKFAKRAAY